MKLSTAEKEFYNRQLLLRDFGHEGQLKLKKSKVLVIGAGGLGCPALQYLAAAGVGSIGIIDSDRVAVSNLHRQILFGVDDVGKYKAACAVEKLTLLNPFINIEAMNFRLTVENTCDILKDYDVIVDGSDNFATRYMVNDACVLTGKTLVYGSVNRFDGLVSVFNQPMPSGERSATYRCIFPSPPSPGSVQNCSDAGVLGVLPGIIGTIQATETIKIITGTGETLSNRMLFADASKMNFTTIFLNRNKSLWIDFPESEQAFSLMNYDYICNGNSKVNSILPREFDKYLLENENLILLDVRELQEEPFDVSALRIPLSELPQRIGEFSSKQPILVVCASGMRSLQAVSILQTELPTLSVAHLEGGWNVLEHYRKSVINE